MSTLKIEDQFEWAAKIARRVARRGCLRGSHVDDLVQVAHEYLVTAFKRFRRKQCPPGGSLEGLFRGWSCRGLYTTCIDEAKRIRAGGLIRKRRRTPVVCEALGEFGHALPAREEIEDQESALTPVKQLTGEERELEAENQRLHERAQRRRKTCA